MTATKKILVIEDDQYIRESIEMILESEGYHFISADNGKVALEKLCTMSELPSLILLDLMMPVMDGFQFRKELEKDSHLNKIPVVVMSADGQINNKQKQVDCVHYLKKPLELDDVVNSVQQYSA